MLERIFDILPTKEVVQFDKPVNNMTVKLPYARYAFERDKYFRYGMHTDMLGIFVKTLKALKPEISRKLLIQARVIDEVGWERLQENTAYRFFYYRRLSRIDTSDRKRVAKILMPKATNITAKHVKRYLNLNFTPESLKKQIGFNVGWYPADFLKKKSDDESNFNSLGRYLGAVNEFKIGSNDLVPGIIRMVGVRMMMNFENEAVLVAKSIQDGVSEKVLRESAKIFRI